MLPPHADMLDLARWCDCPRETVGNHVVEGERGWSDALFYGTDDVVRTLLRRLVTGRGRRLTARACSNDARLPDPLPDRPPNGEARVASFVAAVAPNLYGDVAFLGPFARVLATHPVVEIAEHTVQSVTVVGVGLDSHAWTARLPPLPADRLVLVLSTDDPRLIRHELSHAFYDLDPTLPPSADLSALAVARGRSVVERDPDPASRAVLDALDLEQRRADVLAAVWGFLGR
jgi:hypothetical protein